MDAQLDGHVWRADSQIDCPPQIERSCHGALMAQIGGLYVAVVGGIRAAYLLLKMQSVEHELPFILFVFCRCACKRVGIRPPAQEAES